MRDFKIEHESDLEFIRWIYNEVLADDAEWFYTLEGDFMELRVADASAAAVRSWLEKRKVAYNDRGEYVDPIETTRKHQRFFAGVFHEFAMFNMEEPNLEMEDKEGFNKEGRPIRIRSELQSILERLVHLFCNSRNVPLGKEMQYLAGVAMDRSYSTGWLNGYCSRAGKKMEEKKDANG